ncbi:MAG TPA: hypothetical protein VH413_01050 [Verrucomicrobiae bacterium]|jgi:hypothetical protein|nr:hypothetical protein [Verrucomicrobiae bacterium]
MTIFPAIYLLSLSEMTMLPGMENARHCMPGMVCGNVHRVSRAVALEMLNGLEFLARETLMTEALNLAESTSCRRFFERLAASPSMRASRVQTLATRLHR